MRKFKISRKLLPVILSLMLVFSSLPISSVYAATKETIDCSACNGTGQIDCADCTNGHTNEDCDICLGKGFITSDCPDGENGLDNEGDPCSKCLGLGTIKNDCDDCNATGKKICSVCQGVGTVKCTTCDGKGKVVVEYEKCPDCNGKGACTTCEGKGETIEKCPDCTDGTVIVVCSNCENGKISLVCDACNGSKKIDCIKCTASGELSCGTCNATGTLESGDICPDCSGSGKLVCDTCSGSGKVNCANCNTTGNVEKNCSVCNGNGEITENCSTCNGDKTITVECTQCNGSKKCSKCTGTGKIETKFDESFKFDNMNPSPIKVGDILENAATSKSNTTGKITYAVDNTDIATIDDKGSLTAISVGTVVVTASIETDYEYSSNEIKYSIIIEQATPTIEIESVSEITYGQKLSDSTINAVAKVGNNTVDGIFEWANPDEKPTVIENSEKTEYEIKFTPNDSKNYTESTGVTKIKVNPSDISSITVTGNTYDFTGESYDSVTVDGTVEGDKIEYSVDGKNYTESIPQITNVSDTKTIFVRVTRNGNYNEFNASATATINPSGHDGITFNFEGGAYNGEAYKVEVSGAVGELTYTYDGKTSTESPEFTDVGEYEITVNLPSNDGKPNYKPETYEGKLVISPAGLTIAAKDVEKTYNDEVFTSNEVNTEGLVEGQSLELVSVDGSGKAAGTYDLIPDNAKIVDAKGIDVTNNYTISYKTGTLSILKKDVIVTPESINVKYNANPYSENGYDIKGLVDGHKETVAIEGTATEVGTHKDALSISSVSISNGEDVTNNYEITKNTADIVISYLEIGNLEDTYEYSVVDGKNAWYQSKAVIKAKEGYEISYQNKNSDEFSPSLEYTTEGVNKPEIAIKELSTGYITDIVSLDEIKIDTKNPAVYDIEYLTPVAYKILEGITFGIYNAPTTVKIKASDENSGISSISYKSGDQETVTIDKQNLIKEDDNTYSFIIDIPEKYEGQISYFAEDASGRKSDIKSDENGIIVDTTDPVITSVNYNTSINTNGKYYYSKDVKLEFNVNEKYFYENYLNQDKKPVNSIEDNVSVILETKDGNKSIVPKKTFDEINKKIIVKISAENNDGDYIVKLLYKDPAERKSNTFSTETIVIDTTAPVAEISYEDTKNENRVGEDYFTGRTATITVVEHNFAPEYLENNISIIANDILTAQNADMGIKTKVAEQLKDILVYDNWTHNGDVHTFDLKYVDDAIYDFSLTSFKDYALNEMNPDNKNKVVYADGTVSPESFIVDKVAPSDVEITYSESVLDTLLSGLSFGFYQGNCEVTLTTTDMISGLQYFTYSYDGNDTVITENTNGGEKQAKGWTQNEKDLSKFTYTFTINPQFKGKVTASATDNAGNVTENNTVSDKTIVVDNKNAIINAELSKASNIENGIKYYSDDVTVTVNVNEENFMDGEYPTEVKDININVFCDGKKLDRTFEIDNWSRVNGTDEWKGIFTFGTKDENRVPDGDYRVTIDYTDKSKNVSETCTVDNFTIDTTEPKVNIKYNNNTVSENALNDTYFNANRTSTITVVEHNFAPEYIKAQITAVDVNGKDVTTKVAEDLAEITNADNWKHDGNAHTYVIEYSDDANYTFALTSAKDYALNEMNSDNDNKVVYAENTVSPESFIVDKVAPSDVEITYSESVLDTLLSGLSFGFYQGNCEVTLTTTDETSGVQYFDYSYDVNDAVNTANEGKTVEKAKVTSREGSTYKCEFEIPAQFRGQVTASATDNAGNTSNAVTDGKNIVVDNIAPGINVSYPTPANSNGGIDYYADDVTVTVTVTEENFMDGEFPDDVRDMKINASIEDENGITTTETYEINNWSRVDETDKWEGTFVLKTEGDYTLDISYADKSGNSVSYNNIDDNHKITIDKTAPEVSIKYDNNTVSENALDNTYFDANRTATITVVEHNFAPEYLENNISIIANDILTVQDADMGIRTKVAEQLKDILVYDNWTHDGNLHTFGLKYIDDAIYDFSLTSFKDYALNEMNPDNKNKVVYADGTVSPESFIVDKVAPSDVIIEYSEKHTVLETISKNIFWFFNPLKDDENMGKCTVTLSTTDMTSGLQYFTYSYNGNYIDVQLKNIEDKEIAKEKGFEQNKDNPSKFTYSFEIPAQFRGKVTASATDNSGNQAKNTIDDKTIVVDSNNSELGVSYSTPSNSQKDNPNKVNYYFGDVTVTVTVDEENFMDGEYPSEVRDMKITANIIGDDDKTVTKESYKINNWSRDKDTNKWIGTFILSREGDYTLDISYTDKSGNSVSYNNIDDNYKVTIDTTAPKVNIKYDNNKVNQKSKYAEDKTIADKYYFDKTRTATITVVEHNFAPEYLENNISIIANDILTAQNADMGIKTKVEEQLKDILKYDKWTHNGNVHTFDLKYVDDAIYDFSLTSFKDYALNEMNPNKNSELNNKVIYAKGTVSAEHFVVDKTLPTDVEITYSDDISVVEDVLSKLFWFYNPKGNKPCEVTLTTTDMTSGLHYFTYSYDGNDTVVTENTNGGEKQVKGWTQDKNDLSKFTYTFTIDPQFRGEVIASATDNAGNVTKNQTVSEKTIVVDSVNPKLSVAYSIPSNSQKDNPNKINYYSGNATVTVTVKEENFMDGEYPSEVRDMKINASIEDENRNIIEKSYKIDNWERVNNTDEWKGSFILKDEGDYTLSVSYTDKSGNKVSYSNSSYPITIDKSAPVVNVKFDSIKPVHTIDGREYYNTNRSATITVTEHNFFPKYFETENIVKAQNILGNEVTNYIKYFKNEKNWTTDSTGNVHTIKVDFKSDANYTFDFEFEDLAKNKCDDYDGYLFTVDKTVPKNLKVSYSANVFETVINAITFGYYDSKMTVTVSADDDTTGVYHFMYSYLTAKGVSDVNAQLINDAISRAKITRNGKTSTASFIIPKSSLTRNSQFNGTVEFTAYDYAENNTYKDDTKRVVVDNISPTSTITFNDPVKNANNISYYAGNIDATISINEANFYSQDVDVIVTKDGSRYPVSVNWTDNSVDSHTGTFRLTEDGDYVVRVVYTDRSRNAMATYESNQLTIDTVDPVITVSGLNHQSANNGETIGFSISVTDKNIALSEFKPVLTAVIRNDNGEFETINISLGDPVTSTNDKGETVYTYTVQNLSIDGFYSLTCSAVDYANHSVTLINSGQDNGASANEEMMNFSVNREGSTFWIETTHNDKYTDKIFTNELDKAYANDNVEIVVHELNVDQVNISNDKDERTVFALHDGSSTGYVTLQEGSGAKGNYIKNTLRGVGGWYETRYTLTNDNFAHDGVYSFSILSYDRAGNSNLNTKDDSGIIKFTVDRTNPVITSNISENQVIDADSHTVEFEINDTNHDKNTVEVTLNGKTVPSESITSLGGNSYSFVMSTGSKQSISVTSKDLAGNTAEQYEINDVTVSTNRFVLFYYSHTLLFWIIIAGIVLLACLILFIVFKRKKDDDEEEEK